MGSFGLPVNLDSTYPDDAGDPSRKLHQQHHDTLDSLANIFDTTILTPANGDVPAFNSTTGRFVPTQPSAGEFVNVVTDHGADPTGGSDSTTAFTNAAATGKAVFVPDGTYTGTFNLDPTTTPVFFGTNWGDVTIAPSAGNYFIDANRNWSGGLYIANITFDGGAGAIRNRYTSSNVSWPHMVLNCRFQNYTGPAISHNSSDMPLWKIKNCGFNAANRTTSIGIALNGLTDLCTIEDCEFQDNRIHIKLGYGGNNARIVNNDFVQYNAATAGNPRAFIWVVPQTSANNAGNGLIIRDNKFGNENIDSADYRILYADNGSGTYFGDQLPDTSADSTGYIVQHTVRDCLLNGSGSFQNPLIYSTVTPDRVRALHIENINVAGGRPDYLLKFRTPTTTPNPEGATNTVSNTKRVDSNFTMFEPCNQVGSIQVISDPMGVHALPSMPMAQRGGTRTSSYVNLLAQKINGFTLSTATRSSITDAIGGADAAELTFPGSTYGYVPASAMVANTPIWIEFDMMVGSSDPVTTMTVLMGLDSAGVGGASNYFRRNIVPTSSWRTYRYLAWAPVASNSTLLKFQREGSATGTKAKLGRVRMYHAQEPVMTDLELRNAVTTTSAPSAGGAGALPATPLGYVEVNINGSTRKIAYY